MIWIDLEEKICLAGKFTMDKNHNGRILENAATKYKRITKLAENSTEK